MTPNPASEQEGDHRVLLAVASQLAGFVYVIWRLGWTRHGASAPLFGLVFMVDLWVIVRHVLRCRSWRPNRLIRRGSSERRVPVESTQVGVLLDVGQEPLIQVRVAIRACQEVDGVRHLVVLDRLGRDDVANECRRARVSYSTPALGQHEVDLARAFVLAAGTEFVAVVPAAVWASPEFISLAVAEFEADPERTNVAAVGLRSEITTDPLSTPQADLGGPASDRGGYPLFDDAYYQHGEVGAANHIVVFRTEALAQIGGFQGGRGVGNGSFVSRTLDQLGVGGFASTMTKQPGGRRSAPWDEDLALRYRLDEVARQQTARSPRRLIEAWSAGPRALMLALPAIVAITGLLPLTTGIVEAVVFAGPWFGLSAFARHQAQPHRDWSDLRSGTRALTADLIGLSRGSALAVRPGALTARHARVAFAGLVLAVVGIFAQLAGLTFAELPALANATVIVASIGLLALVRDSIWVQSERQRRSMPRIVPTGGLATSLSPFGATLDLQQAAMVALHPGDEVRLRVRIPQPQRSDWERTITAVASGDGGYVQFDLDDELFDHLLYGCAVMQAAQVTSAELTEVRRTFTRRTLENIATQARGVFVAAQPGAPDSSL